MDRNNYLKCCAILFAVTAEMTLCVFGLVSLLSVCLSAIRLIQYSVSDGLLLFITDIPEKVIEEPQEKDTPVLQESSNGEQMSHEGSLCLRPVLSAGKSQNSVLDSSERPVVTFKENIKPREQSREQGPGQGRGPHQRDGGKERGGYGKGNGAAGKNEQKKEGKRKSEVKKNSHDKTPDAGKQVRDSHVTSNRWMIIRSGTMPLATPIILLDCL